MPSLTYRPEIDGLRAIAVLSVIFYHADFIVSAQNPVPGGFLGVDVFFVISGYLISSIIIKEMDGQGFSFANFYERRARRILPILVTVILASAPLAWMLLIPETMKAYSYSIVTSILFSSNFYFWSEDPYWSTGGDVRPFLHTWSLAVEEQFYFIMPILFLILMRFRNQLRLKVMIAVAVISLVFAQWASGALPEFAFYLLPARMWELLAGTILAILQHQGNRTKPNKATQYLPSLGFLFVILPMFLFTSETQHPSVHTLVPVIGTMLIIWFSNPNDLSVKILSSNPFVAVGLISYGLYIWHFPIFSFGTIILQDQNYLSSLLLILLSFLLSTLTFFLIERPFRNRSLISIRSFLLVIGAATFLGTAFGAVGIMNGYAFRFPASLGELAKPERLKNHNWTYSNKDSADKKRMIIAGDSHMQALAPQLREVALEAGYDVAVSNYSGCQLIAGANRVKIVALSLHKRCVSSLQEERLTFIDQAEPSYVLLGGRLPLILEETRFDNQEGGIEGDMEFFIQDDGNTLASKADRNTFIAKQYQATVDRIIAAGHQIILVYPVPEAGWSVPEELAERVTGKSGDPVEIAANDPVTTSFDVFSERTTSAHRLLDNIKGSGIIRVHPEELFCNTTIPGRCVTHDTEDAYYRDDDHLSNAGAKLLAELVMKQIRNADGHL